MVKIVDRFIGQQIRKPSGLTGQILGHIMANEHQHLVEWMLQYFRIEPHYHVLDIGCGGGMAVKRMATLTAQGHVVGIDYSPSMVRQASRRNATELENHKVTIMEGNVSALPFDDESFDAAYSVETIYFWPDISLGLQEINRVLKPNAMLGLVVDISKEAEKPKEVEALSHRMGFNVYSGTELLTLMEKAGFVRPFFKSAADRGQGWLLACGYKA